MTEQISVYTSQEYNPYKNLATEKWLFENVKDNELILYLWQNQNTVVIGKNQNPWAECNLAKMKEDGVLLARRNSGGGAVFHDLGNLNFTFISAAENYSLERNMEVIALACKKAGIQTEISGRNDILADGRKFSGNAFLNSRGKAYHHGTVLISADSEKMQKYLTPSKAKLEAKGVKSVKSRIINLTEINPHLTCDKMREFFLEAFEEYYGMRADVISGVSPDAYVEEFTNNIHLYGAQPPFTFLCQKRFPWGVADLRVNVKGGIIESAKLYTDAMDENLSSVVESALCGCTFNIGTVKERLFFSLSEDIAGDIVSLFTESEII